MIKDLAEKSRSYRGYDESYTFSREDMLEYIELARLCPSSANIQPLKYYIAYEHEEVEGILACTHFGGALPELGLPFEGTHPTAFIIICQDREINGNLQKFQRDVGAVAQTILLAATEKGLGGLMVGAFESGKLSAVLELAPDVQPLLVLALGKPAERIELVDIPENGSTNYYRNEEGTHFVPKRSVEELLLN